MLESILKSHVSIAWIECEVLVTWRETTWEKAIFFLSVFLEYWTPLSPHYYLLSTSVHFNSPCIFSPSVIAHFFFVIQLMYYTVPVSLLLSLLLFFLSIQFFKANSSRFKLNFIHFRKPFQDPWASQTLLSIYFPIHYLWLLFYLHCILKGLRRYAIYLYIFNILNLAHNICLINEC